MYMNEKGSATGATLAVIALIIASLALVLAWVAYNRTGSDLEDRIQRQVNQSTQQLEESTQQGLQGAEEAIEQGAQEAEEGTNEARQEASDAIEPDDSTTTDDSQTTQ